VKTSRVRWLVLGLTGALVLSNLVVLAVNNLGYTGMWWDETAQFWVSQGLGNYSPPFAKLRGVRDVVRMNRAENLDPGGFSLLLHFWSAHGRGLKWLRGLPFAFYLLGAASLGLLGWRLTRSAHFALAASAVPLLYPAALYFSFEIRAYSMEMTGVAIGALALVHAMEKPSWTRASLLGVTCAAFLTSRYSFVLFTAALCFVFWRASARRLDRRVTRVQNLLAVLLPVFLAAAAVWWITLRHQLWAEMAGGWLGVVSPVYTRASVLGHGANDLDLLWRNLFSPPALPITACALVVALPRRRVYARLQDSPQAAELNRLRSVFTSLYAVILGTQVLSIFASLLGAYPWDIASRWSAYLVMVSALSVIVLGAEFVVVLRAVLSGRAGACWPEGLARRAGGAVAFLVVAVGWFQAISYRQTVESPHGTDLALQIDRLPLASLSDRSVFVAFYEVPVLRYLYEYGPYSGRSEYPEKYRFETQSEWRDKVPIDARGEGIAFVVSNLPFAKARARFPGSMLRGVGPEGSRLLAVAGEID